MVKMPRSFINLNISTGSFDVGDLTGGLNLDLLESHRSGPKTSSVVIPGVVSEVYFLDGRHSAVNEVMKK